MRIALTLAAGLLALAAITAALGHSEPVRFDPAPGQVLDAAPPPPHPMPPELTGELMPGQYVVAWSALSDEDEHADSGCYRFFIGHEAADAAARSGARLDA